MGGSTAIFGDEKIATLTQKIVFKGEDRTKGAVGSIEKNLKKIAGVAAGITAVGGGLLLIATRSIEASDAIGKAAKAAGVGAERLQTLQFASERVGVSAKQTEEGLRRLTRRIGLAADGGGPAAKALDQLGISVTTAGGAVRSTESVFDEAVMKIGSLQSSAERAAAASALFGDDAGPKLALLLAEGTAGVQSLEEAARAYGVQSEEQIAQAERVADSFTNFQASIKNLTQTLVIQFAPALEGVANFLAQALPRAVKTVQAAFVILRQSLLAIVTSITQRLASFYDVLGALPGALGRSYAGAAEDLRRFGDEVDELNQTYTQQLDEIIEETGELAFQLGQVANVADVEAAPALLRVASAAAQTNEELEKLVPTFDNALPDPEDITPFNEAFRETKTQVEEVTESLDEQAEAARRAAEEWERLAGASAGIQNLGGALGIPIGGQVAQTLASALPQSIQQGVGQVLGDGTFQAANFALGVTDAQGRSAQNGAAIGAAIGTAILPGIGTIVGAFLGALVGEDEGETTPRINLVNNLTNQGGFRVEEEAQFRRNSAFGFTIAGQQITEALGAQGAGQFLDTIQEFDERIAGFLNDDQIAQVFNAFVPGGNGETSTLFQGDISIEDALQQRFETIAGALTGTVGEFVQQFTGDLEDGVTALVAITRVSDLLNVDPLEQFAQALERANEGPLDTLARLSDELRDLSVSALDSIEGMESLGLTLENYNNLVVQQLGQIEAARQNISSLTDSTQNSLIFETLDNSGQFEFLTRRANQLAGEFGNLGSAAEVQNQIALINQLTSQAFGLADEGQQQALLNQFLPFLESAETDAQARLDVIEAEIRQQAEDDRQAIADAVGLSITAANQESGIVQAGATMNSAATVIGQAGQAFQQGVNQLVTTPLTVNLASAEIG